MNGTCVRALVTREGGRRLDARLLAPALQYKPLDRQAAPLSCAQARTTNRSQYANEVQLQCVLIPAPDVQLHGLE